MSCVPLFPTRLAALVAGWSDGSEDAEPRTPATGQNRAPMIERIEPVDLKARLDAGEDLVLVDVREDQELVVMPSETPGKRREKRLTVTIDEVGDQ